MAAPTVYRNAKFRLMDKAATVSDWMAVENGRITATGQNPVPKELAAAAQVDLKGKTVLPGLTDAHAHLIGIGSEIFQADLRRAKSARQAADRVAKFAKQLDAKSADPILGHGWDQTDWPGKQYPDRKLLDAISSTKPIVLHRIDGHAAWVNTAALKQAGLWEKKEDPQGGKILRDPKGEPTGILIDTAMDATDALTKEGSPAELERRIRLAVEKAQSLGLVGLHDAGASKAEIEAIRRLLKSKAIRFRFNEMISADDETEFQELLDRGIEVGAEDGQLTVRSVKLYLDGAMGSHGAAFLEPYSDELGSRGLLRMSPEAFEALVRKVHGKGFQIAVHAIGDHANRVAIDTFEKVMGKATAASRPRLEHAQALDPKDIARMGKLGIVASMQPVHCTSDMKWVEERIGKARARYTYAWNSILNAGAPLAFGSDAPVEDLTPWPGLFSAITRQTAERHPKDGFFPEERIYLEQAFRAFTIGAAYAAFDESNQGTLEIGRYADFVVLPKDPFKITPDELLKMKVDATYVGGEKVFPRPPTKRAG